jgi:hypothetical protein
MKEIGEEVKRKVRNPDTNLWLALQGYFEVVEKSRLGGEAKEEIFLDLMKRLLPQRANDWRELWTSFPQTFQGLFKTLEKHPYPRVEAYLLSRLAAAGAEINFREGRPGEMSSLVLAQTVIVRFLFRQHPELVNLASLPVLLKMESALEHRLRLQFIFGEAVAPELMKVGLAHPEGYPTVTARSSRGITTGKRRPTPFA